MADHVGWPSWCVTCGTGLGVVVSLAILPGCQRAAVSDDSSAPAVHEATAPAASPTGPVGEASNPVQAEMRLLHEATRDWVTAIAQHDLASIPVGISRVHAARLVTAEALTRGTYVPPKGGAAALDAFVKQDEVFHDELVTLLQAAKANDLPAATRQLGVVLEGCTSCHMAYRF